MLKLFFALLAMSFEVFASTNGCPNEWVQSADKTTCVQTIINNTTVNSTNDTSRPICITGYTYNSSFNQCQKTTPYNSQTANKTYTFISGLSFGKDPYENDMCLNVSGIQYSVPANAIASNGNCSCNSDYVYNGLTDGSAGCNYVPREVVINIDGNSEVVCPPGKKIVSNSLQCFEGGCSIMFNDGENTTLSYDFYNNSYAYGISDCILSPYVAIYGNITCK
jgi:hypothetical protein